jgi:two-component system sensor kinase FixL
VTDKKQAEEELQRQHRELAHVMRLSTMGEMASGIAHELNQPLAALTSYCGTAATLASSLPSSSPQLVEILERAEKQAHRASQIVWHLREFLGKEDDHKEPVDIDLVIEGVIDFMKPELKSGQVKVEHHSDARGCRVMASKVQIEQVLVNLVMNSLEAINGSKNTTGHIVIQAHLLPDDTIETTVTDNGPGIDADMAGTVFNPFHTSKPFGMGMGLSISRSIIENHDGKLWADEQYRDGARFGFNLPCNTREL